MKRREFLLNSIWAAGGLAWLLKMIEENKKNGLTLPQDESGSRTNFIR